MQRRTLGIAALTLATAAAVEGCTGPKSTTQRQSTGMASGSGSGPSGTMNVLLYQEPAGVFGPLAPASGPDVQVTSLIMQPLLLSDPNYQLKPVLAESFDVSTDAKTFTFKLRQNAKWSDGKPLTSDDVLWSYQILADPKAKSPAAANFAGVEGLDDFTSGKAKTISGLTAPDESTFVIKATEPNYGLLALIGQHFIMPKHILGDVPIDKLADNEYFKKPTVGSGPFTFVEYKTSQYVHVTANKYANPAPQVNDVYLKPVSGDVAVAQVGNGGLDVISFSPSDLKTIKGFSNLEIQEKTDPGFIRCAINQHKKQFKDKRVRQAFLYGVNRKDLVEKALLGKASVQNSDFYGPDSPKDLNQYAYNPDKAKQLLNEAGWDFNTEVKLMWIPGQTDRDTAATVIQSQLSAIGVKLKLNRVQAPQEGPALQNHTFDMILYGGGDYATSPWAVYAITSCDTWYPKGANLQGFCDPKLDALMKKANATSDDAQRKALYDQAAKLENEDADLFWLYSPHPLWAVNKRVSGFVGRATTAPFWNPAAWSITG